MPGMQMPPQGGAPMAPPEGSEGPENQGQEQGQFTKLVTGVSESLSTIQDLLGKEGVPPELTDKLGQLNDQYQSTLQEIMKSMDGGGAPAVAKGSKGPVDMAGGINGVPV